VAALREFQPKELFFAVDGPRNSEEEHIVQQVRNVEKEIDWDCEIHKRFSSVNKGCKQGVFDAIDWFFEKVPQGVILEDDCIPSLSFLNFCTTLLDFYADDNRVYSICGTNHGIRSNEESYYFSSLFHAWGWATWKRAWQGFDVNIDRWSQFNNSFNLESLVCSELEADRQRRNFEMVFKKEIDTWDYSWNFHVLTNHGLNVITNYNGVINIGHDQEGTHTIQEEGTTLYKHFDKFPESVTHPSFVIPNRRMERRYGQKKYGFPLDGRRVIKQEKVPTWKSIIKNILKRDDRK